MFSNTSGSSISLAIVTPSLVIVGEPNFLSRHDVAALGPERDFDRVGEDVRTALERATCVLVKYELLCCHV